MSSLPLISEPAAPVVPFHTYIWKIASRCNLNCTYCFIYNMADGRWRRQPAFMSDAVARRAAARVRDHCRQHGKHDASIILHGGEPLLGGADHLRRLLAIMREEMGAGIALHVGIQSNGLLFCPEIGDLLLETGAAIGVSLDGPPEVNDRFRVDHAGRPSSAHLEERLELLLSPRYRPVFAGFLCVIDPSSDPERVTDYFLQFSPPGLDFLLPHHNYVDPPPAKRGDLSATPYGDWLAAAFDRWFGRRSTTRVRLFDAILSGLFGGGTGVESLGTGAVDLIVVETNGEIEAVDSLKSTYDGATELGFNVFEHDFDTVARDPRVRSRQMHAHGLCRRCRECSLVEVCGGGYLPHRYSGGDSFDNPSVYCADLMKIIHHIRARVVRELQG
jgi:uncharacterized protein